MLELCLSSLWESRPVTGVHVMIAAAHGIIRYMQGKMNRVLG
jgi:hypothetical protein